MLNVVQGEPQDLDLHLHRLDTSFNQLFPHLHLKIFKFVGNPNETQSDILKEALVNYLKNQYRVSKELSYFGDRITLLFTLQVGSFFFKKKKFSKSKIKLPAPLLTEHE